MAPGIDTLTMKEMWFPQKGSKVQIPGERNKQMIQTTDLKVTNMFTLSAWDTIEVVSLCNIPVKDLKVPI